jgi:hypothetical protein
MSETNDTDCDELRALFAEFGKALTRGRPTDGETIIRDTLGARYAADERNDFAAAGIESIEDIRSRWADSFFFGSESDDRTVAHAFNDKANPLGVKINAIYSSEVGHWDVPDLTEVLADSYRLVDQGVITEADFKAWVFDNPYKLYNEANADVFIGTTIESKVDVRRAVAAE